MKIPFETALYGTFRHLPAWSRIPFLLVFFLLNVLTGWGQNSAAEVPEYNHFGNEPMATAGANNPDDIIISIATDSQGYIYTLSFGNGVDKRSPDGSLLQAEFIPANQFQTPLDIVINSKDEIFIADYFESGSCLDNGKIKVFDSNGIFKKNIAQSYFRPLGLALDYDDNIYIAEYYDGSTCENGAESRIRVFDGDGTYLRQTESVEIPYRLAVDSLKNIYVSQAGNNDNPQVLIFDANLNPQGNLPNIKSPGSIVVDKFDFIHVIDYEGYVDFKEFLNYENADIVSLALGVISGMGEFNIKIFSSQGVLEDQLYTEIRFPIDLTFNSDECDSKLFVNNSDFSINLFNIENSTIEFELEIYTRTPSFDDEVPIATCIPSGKEFTLQNGKVTLTVDDINDGSYDNCGIDSMELSNYEFTTTGPHTVSLIVTDEAGNSAICATTIDIVGKTSPEPVVTCPVDSELLPLALDTNCEYDFPNWEDIIETENFTPNFNIISENSQDGELLIELEVLNNGEVVETCFLEFDLVDNIGPEITSCPNNENIKLDPEDTYTIPNYQTLIGISDNCDSNPDYSQSPSAGTEISETTPVTITVTDASNNTDTCSFQIIIEENLSVNCPGDKTIDFDQNCSYVLLDYTDEASATQGATITQDPAPGSVFTAKTDVTLTAELNGETMSCTFDVIPADVSKPEIICFGEQIENYDPAVGYVVPDYISDAGISDNCNLDDVEQTPAEGTTVFEDTEVTITATDEAGNLETCSFWLRLTEDEVLEILCPGDKTGILDDSCNYEVPDYTNQGQVNFNNAVITQDPEPGEIISESTQIRLTAVADGQQDTCIFQLDLSETTPPVASCFDDFTLQLDSNGEAKISEADINNNSTDGCGLESVVIDKTSFTAVDIGENIITLTVTDLYGNKDTCTTTVTVEPYSGGGGDFQCIQTPITLQLNQSGAESLQLTDLYTGDASGLDLVASQSNFTCDDLGENTIELSWTGESSDSCEITVMVEDNIKPVAEVSFISVTLDENGLAEIVPADLDNGSYDNCGELNFSLSKTRFTCENTGQNTVAITLTDSSGNSTTVNTIVFVNANPGTCTEPARDNDYLFLYPNPTDGLVKISPPWGVTVEQVFVFDKRGRFILSKDFDKSDLEYEFRLDGVQNAVYTLQILTSEGEIIRRLIIRD